VGSNGAGKTTLLKTISGILNPTRGVITLDGIVICGMEPSTVVRHGVVHVPEGRHIFPNLTVQDNLILGGYFGTAAQNSENMAFVLQTFPVLKQRLRQRAGMLSGGEQQMLALGRGLMATQGCCCWMSRPSDLRQSSLPRFSRLSAGWPRSMASACFWSNRTHGKRSTSRTEATCL